MNGFFNINKKAGVSSAFVVNRIKHKLQVKCGHMGTLDPLASGVLPIAVGKSTRLFDYLLDKTKEYRAEFTFGSTTDTLDGGGIVTDTCDYIPSERQIKQAIKNMTGDVMQTPPKFSAKNINGRRGYQLARSGVEFELKPKQVHIESIELLEKVANNKFIFNVRCGGGTYIRSICNDLALATSSLAFMSGLVRTVNGKFDLSTSIDIDSFLELDNEKALSFLIKPDSLINFKEIIVTYDESKKLLNGIKVDTSFNDGLYKLYDDSFIGIAESNLGQLKIKTLLR